MNGYFPSVLAGPVPPQYRVTLMAGEHSAYHLRRIARSLLEDWGAAELADEVQLAVTELVANVVRHVPDRRCTVLFLRQATGVRVEVADGYGALRPAPAARDLESEGGRGLLLLAAVADKWGVSAAYGGGKTVWCEVSTAG
ncbi:MULTISPECIES: ATP-binding protein [unclassified Streptomyces]|uniref:ATP-binding protein n=1 Tax=unclassified Streptomyces TaxID=2593676 RepID=UPI0038219973